MENEIYLLELLDEIEKIESLPNTGIEEVEEYLGELITIFKNQANRILDDMEKGITN